MTLKDLSGSAAAVAERAATTVVQLGRGRRAGSGVIVGPGRVLTNAHNVGRDVARVRLADGTAVEARVLGVDIDGDLALLEAAVEGEGVAFSKRAAAIGLPVLALALGHRGPRVTFGTISAIGQPFRGPRGRRISGSIEHTAPMAPGSSGSPLLDFDGTLVGLNTNRLGGGFYLAIPADEALRARIDRLARGEDVERPRLGVAIAPSWVAQRMRAAVGLAPREGLLVREVEPDGRAAAAGILVGDLIVAVAGRSMVDPDDLAEAIEGATGSLEVQLVRGEDELEVSLTLG